MAGTNTKITESQKFQLNRLGSPLVELGNELYEPKNLKDKNIDQLTTDENFYGYLTWQLKGGGASAGATGNVNVFRTQRGNCFESTALGAGQTLFNMAQTTNGLNFAGDAANDEGFAITQGIAQYYAKHAYVIGTDKFYFETKIKISDVSETDTCVVGVRKAEAHQAAYDDYDEMCAFNVNAGDIIWSSILNGAATDNVDTAANVADTNYVKLRLEQDHAVGLSSCISLANAIKPIYTQHIANTAQHTTAADATNVITAADATDLTTLIALVADMLTQYDAHEGDSELGALWLYHPAQETGDDSLASAVAPTTLSECIARTNDLKTKLLQHDDDATSHALPSQYGISVPYASAVTMKYAVNTTTFTTYPNTNKGFCFDLAEVVVPFIQFLRSSGNALTMELMSWKVGAL
jgi:hypothetical protein